MAATRVLFLGAPGVDKVAVMKNLSLWFRKQDIEHPRWHIIDFEKEHLWKSRGSSSFLSQPVNSQFKEWRETWSRFSKQINKAEEESKHLFIGMHGSYSRRQYNLRSVVDPGLIAQDLRPDLVVTLITDIYDMKWRVMAAAKGPSSKGQPTLEQLLSARRQEIIVGDQIAQACGNGVKNVMISTSHPAETLAHCVLHPLDHHTFYLSFPISQPREWESAGDLGPRREVSEFIREAYARQPQWEKLVISCPLGIDEVPFVKTLPPAGSSLLCLQDIRDFRALTQEFRSDNPVPAYIRGRLSKRMQDMLLGNVEIGRDSMEWLIHEINGVMHEDLYRIDSPLRSLALPPEAQKLLDTNAKAERHPRDLIELNRLLLEIAFPAAVEGLQTRSIKGGKRWSRKVKFDRDLARWDLGEFWDVSSRLCRPPELCEAFDEAEMQDVRGNIMTDITWRDYRLVDQADELLVFNPVFKGREHPAGSVMVEVDHATMGEQPKTVYIYQDPLHDTHNAVATEMKAAYDEDAATMAGTASSERRIRVKTLVELFGYLTRLKGA